MAMPTARKAKEILKDGTVHGQKLTVKQKALFQALAHGWRPKRKPG